MFADCLNRLVLPPSHKGLLERSGATPPYEGDQRRFLRRYAPTQAALEYHQSLPALPRQPQRHVVLVLDLSRSGIGFFHSEQLFPRERAVLSLAADKQLPVEIAWCQRVSEKCYHVGAKFTQVQAEK